MCASFPALYGSLFVREMFSREPILLVMGHFLRLLLHRERRPREVRRRGNPTKKKKNFFSDKHRTQQPLLVCSDSSAVSESMRIAPLLIAEKSIQHPTFTFYFFFFENIALKMLTFCPIFKCIQKTGDPKLCTDAPLSFGE